MIKENLFLFSEIRYYSRNSLLRNHSKLKVIILNIE